jgi:hypothetical protein
MQHALTQFSIFFDKHPLVKDLPLKSAIISALSLVMTNNVFKFGNTFFLQRSGTAMGTPPACMYATLYYFIHKEQLLKRYRTAFLYFKRYIDNILIVANISNTPVNTSLLQQDLAFGQLNWKVSTPSSTCTFLNVMISKATNEGSPYISTTRATKPMNLHTFIPSLSCHPTSTL